MPAVSIITPTYGRPGLIARQHAIVAAQTLTDFEWLILDDSPAPSPYFATLDDSRVHYHHHPGERMLVSAKRNWLCERATASVIAQFDDDDYYAPPYLATMLGRLEAEGTDLVKLSQGDGAAIGEALYRVLTEPDQAQRMRAEATLIAPSLRWSAVADRYRALAADLLAGPTSRPARAQPDAPTTASETR